MAKPEKTVRWHRRRGDVAMWDDWAGIEGRTSVALRGDASARSVSGA
jgi:hypothetical protein